MYAEALTVLDSLGQVENHDEEFTSVSQGEDVELKNTYLIQNSFTVNSSDQDVEVYESGSIAATSDYEVDLRDGTVTWNGTDGVDLRIRYKVGPIPNEVVVSEIKSATEEVDQMTNTTFDGTEEVTHTYDMEKGMNEIVLFNRPVQNLSEARVNRADVGKTDDFEVLEQGRSGDIYLQDDISIQLTPSASIAPGKAKLELTYTYGYEDLPDPINKLVRAMTENSLMENTVLGEVMDGRDDYGVQLPGGFMKGKQQILNNWTVNRFGEPVPAEIN